MKLERVVPPELVDLRKGTIEMGVLIDGPWRDAFIGT